MAQLIREVADGDAARGEDVFRRADLSCLKCHAVSQAGGQIGPDLSALGSTSPVDYIINSIYDPDVLLSRLLGSNRRFIETRLPHIGELLKPELAEVIADSEMLIVGVSNPTIFDALATHGRPGQRVLDLVNLPNAGGLRAQVEGLCW